MTRRFLGTNRVVATHIAGPVKLVLLVTGFDRILTDADQYEIIMAVDNVRELHEIVIGRRAALARFEELKDEVALIVAKRALGLEPKPLIEFDGLRQDLYEDALRRSVRTYIDEIVGDLRGVASE